jgi:hypothetical protein
MMQCSHGIDIDRPCQQCTDEALARIEEEVGLTVRQIIDKRRNSPLPAAGGDSSPAATDLPAGDLFSG